MSDNIKQTQCNRILRLFEEKKVVTTYDFIRLKICQYNARISDLRHKRGIDITCELVHDGYKRYGIYTLNGGF